MKIVALPWLVCAVLVPGFCRRAAAPAAEQTVEPTPDSGAAHPGSGKMRGCTTPGSYEGEARGFGGTIQTHTVTVDEKQHS